MDRVTVFEAGARVTRRASLQHPAPAEVIIFGLPLGLLDDSVRVSASGAVATMATVLLEAPGENDKLAAPTSTEVIAARRAAALADGEIERLRRELEAIEQSPLVVELGDKEPPASWAASTVARRQLAALRQHRTSELRLAMIEAQRHAKDCGRVLAAAVEQEARRSSERSPRAAELRKAVRVTLTPAGATAGATTGATAGAEQAAGQGGVELSLEYAVRGARWVPSYVARIESGSVELTMRASLVQRTGEDWTDVDLSLSAERPSLGVEPPELSDDELEVRPRPATVQVQAREQEIERAGGGSDPSAAAPTVMGIDDGGLGLVLRPATRATIAADGRPHRVTLSSFQSDAEVELLAIPLRSPLCHVRTRFTNHGKSPLLAGPVDLVRRAGVVGRGETGFLAAGERATLGFGSEPEVRVHRELREEQDEGSILSGSVTRTVRVIIRVSNLGSSARQVLVQDRVPVSELEQVVVTVSAPEAFRLERERRPGEAPLAQITERTIDEHGLVTWVVPLAPRGRAAVALEYRIKSPRGFAGL